MEANNCEYDEEEKTCSLSPDMMSDYKPATAEGQNMMDTLIMPNVKCSKITTAEACTGMCIWGQMEQGDESSCEVDMSLVPTKCDESEKTPVTLLAFQSSENARCGRATPPDADACTALKNCKAEISGQCVPDTEEALQGIMGITPTTGAALQLDPSLTPG